MTDLQRTRIAPSSNQGRLQTSPAPRRWAATRLSLVKRAGESMAREDLSALCELYWYPVHSFICSLGVGAEDARDITQGFLTAKLLERNSIAAFDPARSSFRAWLRTCARYYVSNWRAHVRTETAGGKAVHISLDAATATERARLEPRDWVTPERLFDKHHAQAVVGRALASLRDQYAKAGKAEVFAQLLGAALEQDGRALTNRELAVLLGKSEGAVKVEKHRLVRRDFVKCLRAEVSRTLVGPGSLDDEIRQLIEALIV